MRLPPALVDQGPGVADRPGGKSAVNIFRKKVGPAQPKYQRLPAKHRRCHHRSLHHLRLQRCIAEIAPHQNCLPIPEDLPRTDSDGPEGRHEEEGGEEVEGAVHPYAGSNQDREEKPPGGDEEATLPETDTEMDWGGVALRTPCGAETKRGGGSGVHFLLQGEGGLARPRRTENPVPFPRLLSNRL